MTNLYFVRHGFTPANNAKYNNQKNIYTIADDKNMPLDYIYGVKQAREVGTYLNNLKGKTLILVSPYKRAKETMLYALENVNFDYEIKVENDLHEINSGVHYAKTVDELFSMYDGINKVLENLEKDPYNTRYLDGESQFDVKNRVEKIAKKIKDIKASNIYDNIIIFGHGIVNRWIIWWITGKLYEPYQKNGDILLVDDDIKLVFSTKAYAPIGYKVDINKYKQD